MATRAEGAYWPGRGCQGVCPPSGPHRKYTRGAPHADYAHHPVNGSASSPGRFFGGAARVTLEVVAAGAARFGLVLQSEQLERMARFVELLLDRNRHLNLTRIVDPA